MFGGCMAKSNKKSTSTVAQVSKEERTAALKRAMEAIEKNFGAGSLVRLGDKPVKNVEVIPSGVMSLDAALGAGGYPRGRIIEIFGHESSGKTTVTLQAIAACQKNGGIAAFIDAEHALDPAYARNIGVDIDNLLVSQPDNGEQALDIAEAIVRSGAVDLIVIDSVAALVPKSEIEGTVGDVGVGVQARMMSKALRKLTSVIAKSNCVCIFINQLRNTINSYGAGAGGGTTTTGGRALKFYSSVRLDVKKTDVVRGSGQEKDSIIGITVNVKIVKNKVAPPFGSTSFNIYFGRGVDHVVNVITVATDMNILRRTGAWYSYEGKNIGQGLEKTTEYLRENEELFKEIEQKVRQALNPASSDSESSNSDSGNDSETNLKKNDNAKPESETEVDSLDDIDDADDIFDDILGLDDL